MDTSLIWVIDTILLVIDVPTLVPMTMGIAFLEIEIKIKKTGNILMYVQFHIHFEIEMPLIVSTTYLTGITPAATSPTIIEVTVEELCISTVAKIPSIKPGK